MSDHLLKWESSPVGWSWWVQNPALLSRNPEVLDMLLSCPLPASCPGVIERASVCQVTSERQEEMASSCALGYV